MSYSQQTGLFYIPANHWAMDYWTEKLTYKAGSAYLGQGFRIKRLFDDHVGTLRAIDPKSGKIVWEHKEKFPLWAGTMTTAGGLLFTVIPGINLLAIRSFRPARRLRIAGRRAVLAVQAPHVAFNHRPRPDFLTGIRIASKQPRVIYHLCKHRGFHWISRAEEKQAEGDGKSEGGKVKQGLAGTAKRMDEKGYRSGAEMMLAEFPEAQRNKQGEYRQALSRVLLAKELALLFTKQREFGNLHAQTELEQNILGDGDGNRKNGLFWQQKPALAGADLLKMLGKCTFENGEYRAPKASFTAERHVWLTRLNNLRIVTNGVTRQLTDQERSLALPLPYRQAGDLTYKQLGAALTQAGLLEAGSFKFIGLAYPN